MSTFRRCLRVAERAGAVVAGGPARRAGKHAQREHARACRTTSQRKNRCADAFQKQNRTRTHAVVYVTGEIFKKKGKRKPTCHFPSSGYSLASLGVFTFRIVLNRILHKSSLLAPMESRTTRRPSLPSIGKIEEESKTAGDLQKGEHGKDGSRHRPGDVWIACGLPKPVPRRRLKRRWPGQPGDLPSLRMRG